MARNGWNRRPVNGAVVARARAERHLTRVQVCDLARAKGYLIDDSNLGKLERGKLRYPGLETRLGLTKALGLTDAEMHAPCEICGEGWSAARLDHPDRQHSTEAA